MRKQILSLGVSFGIAISSMAAIAEMSAADASATVKDMMAQSYSAAAIITALTDGGLDLEAAVKVAMASADANYQSALVKAAICGADNLGQAKAIGSVASAAAGTEAVASQVQATIDTFAEMDGCSIAGPRTPPAGRFGSTRTSAAGGDVSPSK